MDINSKTAKLCIEGTQAEFEGRIKDAHALYLQAWVASTNDYDACIAAHYVARFQANPQDTLRWNQEALARANAVGDERVQSFYPSLYVNLGHSNEMLGNQSEAQYYYKLAADLGLAHQIENPKSEIQNDQTRLYR